jgi:hypothetical protein
MSVCSCLVSVLVVVSTSKLSGSFLSLACTQQMTSLHIKQHHLITHNSLNTTVTSLHTTLEIFTHNVSPHYTQPTHNTKPHHIIKQRFTSLHITHNLIICTQAIYLITLVYLLTIHNTYVISITQHITSLSTTDHWIKHIVHHLIICIQRIQQVTGLYTTHYHILHAMSTHCRQYTFAYYNTSNNLIIYCTKTKRVALYTSPNYEYT